MIAVSTKLWKMQIVTLKTTTAKVRYNTPFSNEIKIEEGVEIGDDISPTHFNLILEAIIRKMNSRNNKTSQLQIIVNVDDLAIMTTIKISLKLEENR